jgi:thiamine-phosphate pyrophosphorylase
LHAAIAGGADVVQLRDKRLDDEELARTARTASALCRRLGALFIVNDRPAVALEAGADGVHVGQEDMPVERVRELVGPDVLIGLSTHTPEEIDAVQAASRATGAALDAIGDGSSAVDYIGVGPVHSTPTKPGRTATGVELVRYAAMHARVPFFAIGGIDAVNIASVVAAGGRRIAVVRAIADAGDPGEAARALHARLDDASGDLRNKTG